MKKKIHVLWVAILTVILSIIIVPTPFQAETMDDPAPIIHPESPNGKKVLFDNMHAQTAGQADWVIDGAFSDFAEGIAGNGYQVEELRKNSPFTIEDLEDYDVFVIPEANIPFKKVEQDAMVEYVENGGSIFFISDHYNADRNKNRWDSSEVMNGYRRGAHDNPTKGMSEDEKNSEAMQGIESSDWLSDNFGIRFRYNAPGTVVANHIVDPAETFGITEGVGEVTMHAGSTLAITDPEVAKGIVFLPDGLDESDMWGPSVDQGIYHGGGVEEGPYAAISKLGDGKAAFIGDSSPVEDITPKYRNEETGKRKTTYDGFIDADNGTLLLNMIDWLAEDEAYQDFTETDIPLDEVSPLLDMEIPENSTEPQHEPWTNPQPHYKWYDPSTFAAGSFGSSEDPLPEPEFALNYDSVLPNDQEFTIEIIAEGLAPGQTISGYNLGIYLDGGTQVAKVQNADGSWPSGFGYSEEFSLQANSDGVATKTLTVQVNENAVGDANVRLRQGGTNLITRSAVIDSGVGGEPEEPKEPEDPISEPKLSLNFDSVLPNDQEFTIEVVAEGLEPGQTVSDYSFGIYLDGGQQIAKVQNADGSWPSNYGYSKNFALEANNDGVATKTLTVQVNENVDGDANLRLRQGKTNLITETASFRSGVGEEPEENLLTIKQARDLADGKVVEVEGVITTEPGLFGGKGFYLQDETAGIYVFQHSDAYSVGDVVKIKGTMATFNGLKELEDIQQVEITGESELPKFNPVEGLDESNQGQRVTLEGEIENIKSYWNAFEFDVRNEESLTRVRIDNRTNISFEEFTDLYQEGDAVSVSGVASIFYDTYQLLLTDLDHVQSIENSAPVINELSDFNQFVITESYQIPVDVHDEDGDLESVVIEINGNTMEDMIQIAPLEFTPGTYEVKVTASDEAGNVTEQSFSVEAVLLLSELDELIEFGVEEGYVAAKMEKRLIKKATDVQTAKNESSRNGKWNALLNQMEAQLGKRIQNDYMEFWERPIDM